MIGDTNLTAGGRPPAASRSRDWIDWRERQDRPVYAAKLWPNRPLTERGRKTALGIAAVGLAVPLIPAIGSPVFWGLLPFLAGALALLWLGLRRNILDGRLAEWVAIWPDEMRVERREPGGLVRRWRAEPFHVRLTLHAEGKVEQYLTLRATGSSGAREIELGAFLSPEERVALAGEIEAAIGRAIRGGLAGAGV